MRIRHEDKATDTRIQHALNELLRRRVVARLPQVRTKMRPNSLKKPFGHQMGMDIDDRVERLDRHPSAVDGR